MMTMKIDKSQVLTTSKDGDRNCSSNKGNQRTQTSDNKYCS